MARPNLALVLVYGGRDNLVEKPKSVKDDAPAVKTRPAAGGYWPPMPRCSKRSGVASGRRPRMKPRAMAVTMRGLLLAGVTTTVAS